MPLLLHLIMTVGIFLFIVSHVLPNNPTEKEIVEALEREGVTNPEKKEIATILLSDETARKGLKYLEKIAS